MHDEEGLVDVFSWPIKKTTNSMGNTITSTQQWPRDVTVSTTFRNGAPKQTHTFKNVTEQEKKKIDELGRVFTVKGIVIAYGFSKKYGPEVKGGERAYQKAGSFMNVLGKPEWALLVLNVPLALGEQRLLVRPDKMLDFTRKFMPNVDYKAVNKYVESLTKETIESAKAKIVGLSDEELLLAIEGISSNLRKFGLAKSTSSAASAAVAAVAPVAVAAATGGLAGGGRRAQNRLLMALLLGLALWLLLKPKKSSCGCSGRDRER